MEAERHKPIFSRALAVAAVALNLCAPAHAAPKYKVLHYFSGADGSGPYGGVTLGDRGTLYGATVGGGSGVACNRNGGCGVVFQLTPQGKGQWSEQVLYSFCSDQNCTDGVGPMGSLFLDASGGLYSTTNIGGAYNAGTVFELTHASGGWEESVLYSFGAQNGDGGGPTAGLVMDAAGTLYGTAAYGGSTAFELTFSSSGWNETLLHGFGVGKGDGAGPFAGLILDSVGNLYGTTAAGGVGCAGEGCGTVYELTPVSGGWNETVLHSFDNNGKDGVTPGSGSLILDASGSLYGTTEVGGAKGWGTVFKLKPGADGKWTETILHNFRQGTTGSFPAAGVVMDKAGNLYGTTVDGGSGADCGVVYRLAPKPKREWKYTVLHPFYGYDGCVPAGNLIIDKKGNLYGGTVLGGTTGNGVIFKLTP